MPDWDAAQVPPGIGSAAGVGTACSGPSRPARERGDRRHRLRNRTADGRSSCARERRRTRLTAADRSWTMVTEARRYLPSAVPVVQATPRRCRSPANAFDAVFSTATFHWIADHATLFAEIHRVLRAGGRLVAQAGGGRIWRRSTPAPPRLSRETEFAEYFGGWRDPWTFAGIEDTRERLERAGFADLNVTLESAPTPSRMPERYADFITTVCLRHHLHRLPESKRAPFVDRLTRRLPLRRSALHPRLLAAEYRCPKALRRATRERQQRYARAARRAAAHDPPCSRVCGSRRSCPRWQRSSGGSGSTAPSRPSSSAAVLLLVVRDAGRPARARRGTRRALRGASSRQRPRRRRGWLATGTPCPQLRAPPDIGLEGHPVCGRPRRVRPRIAVPVDRPWRDRVRTSRARRLAAVPGVRAGDLVRARRQSSELAPLDDWREQLAAFGVLGGGAPARLDRRVPALGRERRARHCAGSPVDQGRGLRDRRVAVDLRRRCTSAA